MLKKVRRISAGFVIIGVLVTGIFYCAPFALAETDTVSWIQEKDIPKWTQFRGKNITLNIIGEDTPAMSAIAHFSPEFEQLTGINVELTQTDIESITIKVLLDFTAESGRLQVFWSDAHQTLPQLYSHIAPLNKFMDDPSLPSIPLGEEDFVRVSWLQAAYFIDKNTVRGIPYTASVIGCMYRKDVFENAAYKDLFMKEKGYDWTPGLNLTWEQWYEIAEWINEKVQEGVITEVKWATGHMAKQHDSLQCDFSNVLSAFGGDYFKGKPGLGTYGSDLPGPCTLDEPESIAAARFYKKLIDVAAPGSTTWDWGGVHDAFAAGNIALIPQWLDFAPWVEDPEFSKIAGKVGYTVLPRGPSGESANNVAPCVLAINGHAPEIEQKAGWLFLIWATGPAIMKIGVPLGYTMPSRYSVYESEEALQDLSPGLREALVANLECYAHPQIRPKIAGWVECNTVVYTELSKMLAGVKSPEQAMKDATRQIDEITGWAKLKGE